MDPGAPGLAFKSDAMVFPLVFEFIMVTDGFILDASESIVHAVPIEYPCTSGFPLKNLMLCITQFFFVSGSIRMHLHLYP